MRVKGEGQNAWAFGEKGSVELTKPGADRPYLDALVICASLASLVCFMEVGIASRDPIWIGGTLRQWLEVLAVWAIYTAAMFTVATLMGRAISVLRSLRVPEYVRVAAGAATASLVLSSALQFQTVPAVNVLFICATLGLLAIAIVLRRLAGIRMSALGCVWTCAIVSGAACLPLTTWLMLMDERRADVCMMVGVAWCVLGGIAATLALGILSRCGRSMLVGLLIASGICALAPVLLWTTVFLPKPRYAGDSKSVLFVTADALRADYCSVYGGRVPTPSLERLAERGVLFERHYSLAPYTHPSLSGLLSSKYPPGFSPDSDLKQRVLEASMLKQAAEYWLDEEGKTFAHRVAETRDGEKRITAVLMGNPTMEPYRWLMESFQHKVIIDTLSTKPHGHLELLPVLQGWLLRRSPSMLSVRTMDSTGWLMRYTNLFLRRHGSRPFFLWVHFFDPHTPYEPPARYLSLDATRESWWPQAHGRMKPEEAPGISALYEGEIAYLDWAMGEILAEYDSLGLADSTFLCFSSDHGEAFMEHGYAQHANTLYDEEVRVPLILAGPGIEPQCIKTPVSAIDVIPTFARLLEISPSTQWRGKPLTVTPNAAADKDTRDVFALANNPELETDNEPQQMLVKGDLKLILGTRTGKTLLYDLKEDPSEINALPLDDLRQSAVMLDSLRVWADSFPSTFAKLAESRTGEQRVDPEYVRLLEDIGYIGGE